tara:strand:+ start:12712 stop:13464 length:753 start_codon:yes stop_codon:yes gene_type:complete
MKNKLKCLLLEKIIFPKGFSIQLNQAIVSFTFDDIPYSSISNGAKILEKFGHRGTFYISTSAMNKSYLGEAFATEKDLTMLHKTNHDIQCHTKSHTSFNTISAQTAAEDCEDNRAILKNIVNKEITHFSYPLGQTGFLAKRHMQKNYLTSRSTQAGLNYDAVDLSFLRANAIYSKTFNKKDVDQLISDAINNNAWLIFYTHDIKASPTDYGATIDEFEYVVEQCHNRIGQIETIERAYKKIINNANHIKK